MSEWEGATWHAMWTVAVEEEAKRAALRGDDGPPNRSSFLARWRERRRPFAAPDAGTTTPRTPER